MTPEQRKEIEERVAAATAGPWEVVSGRNDERGEYCFVGIEREPEGRWWKQDSTFPNEKNATFIAHARTDIPAILSALDAAETRAKTAEEALRELWDDQRKLDQYEILRHPERMPNLAKWLKAQGCGE